MHYRPSRSRARPTDSPSNNSFHHNRKLTAQVWQIRADGFGASIGCRDGQFIFATKPAHAGAAAFIEIRRYVGLPLLVDEVDPDLPVRAELPLAAVQRRLG